ncbi:MAG: zinc ribbon domain-containing protein, partial [Slackia sp.]|nr:zinc ribbon domain-containing protein [Slackia sp.]
MAGYCTWCGARLDENARYCPSCGARTTQVVTVDGSPDAVDPLRGLDIVEGERLPVEDTQRMKITEMSDKVVVSSGKARRFTQDTAIPKRRAAILV